MPRTYDDVIVGDWADACGRVELAEQTLIHAYRTYGTDHRFTQWCCRRLQAELHHLRRVRHAKRTITRATEEN